MKIVIATPLYPPDVGGPATYSRMLERGLPSRDIDVELVSFGSVRHLLPLVRHLVYFFVLLRAVKDHDAVYALDPWSVGVPAMVAATIFRKPFIVKIVGDYAWEQGVQRFGVRQQLDTFSKPVRARRVGGRSSRKYHPLVQLFKFGQWLVARRAVRVVVPSEYLCTIVSNWGIPKERISVIHNGFRDFNVGGRKQVLRGMVKARGDIVLSAGRLVPWKGFDTLIKAIAALQKKFPELKLVIAGDGPELDRLEKLTAKLSVENRVIFLGRVDQDVLMSYIKLSDVFALNTSYEGFSHQLLEVMAVGIPIVTTNVGGNPEIITNGVHGLLVKRNNAKELEAAIATLLTDRALKDRLVRAAKRRVQDFSEEEMLGKTAVLLKRTIQ